MNKIFQEIKLKKIRQKTKNINPKNMKSLLISLKIIAKQNTRKILKI